MSATVAYREIIFDLDLYPRMEVDVERVQILKDALDAGGNANADVLAKLIDRERVDHLREIIAAGGVLPPIVVDRETRKVVDGFHRSRAYFALHGKDAAIPCTFHDYEDKAAMFLDAIRLNASHGKPLTRRDQTRCVALAERLNVTLDQVASVLNMRPGKVADLKSVRAKLATPVQVQTLRFNGRNPHHARMTSGGDPADNSESRMVIPKVGLAELNALIRAIKGGELDIRERRIRDTVRFMVKVALERLKETEA